MPKTSALQFKNYTVNEISFKMLPVAESETAFEITSNFQKELISLNDNDYDLVLSINIDSSEEKPLPFALRISITGHFSYQDNGHNFSSEDKEFILNNNTGAILFPFLRSLVASVTANANIPSLVLPVMDFSETEKSPQ